jgi:hypothetical protein
MAVWLFLPRQLFLVQSVVSRLMLSASFYYPDGMSWGELAVVGTMPM